VLGNGSIEFPFVSIQNGIDSAISGDTILIHPGTYFENINFNGKNVKVGSWFLTTADASFISQTIIDGNQIASVVTCENGEDNTAVLCGLKIMNGLAQGEYPQNCGGGIYINGASPKISNVIFNNNTSQGGGALYCLSGADLIVGDCLFEGNTTTGEPGDGGAILLENCNANIFNNQILNNTGNGNSAGIAIWGDTAYIEQNQIISNLGGPGIYIGNQAIVQINENVVSEHNNANGAIFSNDAYGNIYNNVIINNQTGIHSLESDSMLIINNTVFENSIYGLWFESIGTSNVICLNNIIWGNSTQVFIDGIDIYMHNNDIQDGQAGVSIDGGAQLTWDESNIDYAPLFVDEENKNYQLSSSSLCIGAGTESVEIEGTTYYAPITDFEGNLRPNPPGSNPDIGAYENDLSEPQVNIPDENFRLAINETLGQPPEHLPTVNEMASITYLEAGFRNIESIEGAEFLVNVNELNLYYNQIGDLSYLSGLMTLGYLHLWYNQVSDLTPLSNLTGLQYLELGENPIGDIAPISNLDNLVQLSLHNCQISILPNLSNLTSLNYLHLGSNQINDLLPFSQLSNLQSLELYNNQISDITDLSNLSSSLTQLNLGNNQISDLLPLSGLSNLQSLQLNDNQIIDIAALSNLSSLYYLNLGGNQVSDLTFYLYLAYLIYNRCN